MKQKSLWIAISVIFAIVVILGGLYFTTDLFKTPEQLFYKHFAQSSNLLGGLDYEKAMRELEKQNEASSEIAGEITAKVSSNKEDIKEISDILDKGKILYNVKTVGTEKSQSDITLNYNKKDIITLNLLQNKEQYGIKIAEAYDKYVSVENNDLKALFKKLGVDATDIPNKIEMLNYNEFLKIDKKTLKHIEQTYSKIMKENIPDECYTIEKNAKTTFNGSELKTNAYKLKLTEEQVKNLLVKMLEVLKTDDITLDLIISKYKQMIEPYKAMGMSIEENEITKEDLKEALEEALEDLNKEIVNNQENLEVVVYAVKDGISKIEMAIVENEKDLGRIELGMVNTNENKGIIIKGSAEDANMHIVISYKDNNTSAIVTMESEGNTITFKITQDIKATKNVTVEDFTKDNSVKLNDMTKEEIESLVETISTNIVKALPQKMDLLGINTTGPTLPTNITGVELL